MNEFKMLCIIERDYSGNIRYNKSQNIEYSNILVITLSFYWIINKTIYKNIIIDAEKSNGIHYCAINNKEYANDLIAFYNVI